MDEELEKQYRKILFLIKPHILNVKDTIFIRQYRLWLDKLSDMPEKKERNQYLFELCNQIRSGTLTSPFTEVPPPGKLPPPYKVFVARTISTDENSWYDIEDNFSEEGLMIDEPKLKTEGLELQQHYGIKYKENHCKGDENKKTESATDKEQLKLKLEELVTVRGVLEKLRLQLSEWKDKYDILQIQANEKRDENIELKANINELNLAITELQNMDMQTKTAMNQEMDSLKERLYKSNNIIEDIKKQHVVTIQSINEGNENIIKEKDKLIENYTNLLKAETDKWEEEIKKKEELEKKFSTLIEENEKTIQEKNETINQLTTSIQDLTTKYEEEKKKNNDSNEHIIHLKRTLSKAEKYNKKIEKDNNKYMEKIRKEYELKERTIEIKFHNDRFSSLSRSNEIRMVEIDEVVKNLESKYQKLFETLHQETSDVRRKNTEIIDSLKIIVDKHEGLEKE